MLTLYLAPGSSSMAPHVALHEIGAPFERRLVSLAKKEQREAAFIAHNPEGKVPVLLIDGRPLTEVAAILFYLARTFPEARLLPTREDIEGEAHALSWMSFIASTIHPARRHGIEVARAAFALADSRLGDRAWALESYSVVDIHLFRLYWRFRGWVSPEPGRFPRLDAHYDLMMARPAVRRTCDIEATLGYELPAPEPAAK